MIDTAIIDSLVKIVGTEHVLSNHYDLDRYSGDALTPFRAFGAEQSFERLAEVVVRPRSVQEVSAIVSLANLNAAPLIPYGGGTGVMGSVLPVRGGIILDLKRLNQIIEVNPRDLTAVVEAGVVLENLVTALSKQDLMPGHDPYSVPIATMGGTISTNGVGYRAAAFGPMGEQVVALEVVLPNGRVMSTRAVPKTSSGPNLNQLFIGTEGVFGVITKATIKVYRQPEAHAFATAGFNNFDQGFAATAELLALGIRPTLLDLTEEDNHVRLHLLFEGYREGVAAEQDRSMRVCAEFGGRDIGPQYTLKYWEERHESADNYKLNALGKPREVRWNRRRGRSFDYLHLALPISKVLDYRHQCEDILAKGGIKVVEYGLWSRPEMFSMMVVPVERSNPNNRENLGRVVDQVLTLAQDMGGIMEYCHGVGVKLNHLVARERGAGHEVIRSLKQTLDPNNIMNPGKLGL